MDHQIQVKVDFSGGLDLVFDGRADLVLHLEEKSKVRDAIRILGEQEANSKKDMFYQNQSMYLFCLFSRPGILVLINDVDWELAEREDYVLEPGDKLSFISTLHGG